MEGRLREKLELESRALQVVERLLEDRVTEDFLTDCVSVNLLHTESALHASYITDSRAVLMPQL